MGILRKIFSTQISHYKDPPLYVKLCCCSYLTDNKSQYLKISSYQHDCTGRAFFHLDSKDEKDVDIKLSNIENIEILKGLWVALKMNVMLRIKELHKISSSYFQ
jgi:hypothetical protein